MRKHLVIAALALASLAFAAQTNPASASIDCDRQGCREVSSPANGHRAGHSRRSAHQSTHRSRHAAKTRHGGSLAETALGVVRSQAGAAASVALRAVAKFQGYIRALEAHGARIYYMGGIRRGRCSPASQHPCGLALDVCQDYRGHVSGERDCHLPPPAEMASIAKANGLHEGSLWCRSPDYGHAQVIQTGSECPARGTAGHHYLASITGKIKVTQ